MGVGWNQGSGGGGIPLVAQDEGVSVDVNVGTLNFTGAGVTAISGPAGTVSVNIPGAAASTFQTVYNASTPAMFSLSNANGPFTIRNSMVSLDPMVDIQTQTGVTVFSINNTSVTINGKLNVTGGIDPIYLAITEQGSNPWTVAAGMGTVWVENIDPTRLHYVDDKGNDFLVAGLGMAMANKQQEVVVAKSGGHFDTIGAALASITDASAAKPYIIRVFPGVYTENPLTMKQYVSICGSGCDSTYVQAANNSSVLFSLVDHSKLCNFCVAGPTSSVACRASGISGAKLQDIHFTAGSVGVQATGAGAQLIAEQCKFDSAVTIALEATTGARIDSSNCLMQPASIAVYANGGTIWVHNSGAVGSTYALRALSGGIIYPQAFSAENCTYVLSADGLGSKIEGASVVARGTTSYDVLQANNGYLDIVNARLDPVKFSVSQWDHTNIMFGSELEDEEAFISTKNFYVGRAEFGTESRFGAGETTTRGLLVYTYDAFTSIFSNVTAAAASRSGSQFLFPTAQDSCLYIASDLLTASTDYMKFLGIRQILNTAATWSSPTEIVAEYWDGSNWTAFNIMVVDTTSSKMPHPKSYNWSATGEQNVNFDINIETNWAKNDPPSTGTNRYWVRFRVNGGSLSSSPVFEHIALHTNHVKVEDDGWIVYRGKARPVGRISWDINMAQPANDSPANQDLYIGDRLNCGRLENNFQTGARDRSGWNTYLPLDIDTSCPIKLRWSWVESNSNTNNIEWHIRWGYTSDGDSVFLNTSQAPPVAATEQQITLNVPGSGARRTQVSASVDLDVSDMVARRSSGNGDILWVTIERRGDLDSFTGNCAIINISPYYTKWCEGGHF